MDSLYNNSIFKHLTSIVEKSNSTQKFNTILPKGNEVVQHLFSGNLSILPLISLSNEYNYIVGDILSTYQTIDDSNEYHSYEYNYSEAIPANLRPSFTLIATDISHIIEMEKLILDNFSSEQRLTFEHPNKPGEKILFNIAIDNSSEVERTNQNLNLPNYGNCTLYQSIIRLRCHNCAMFLPEFHSVQIQLDKNVQLQLVSRGRALEELSKTAETAQGKITEQIQSAKTEISKLLGLNTMVDYGFTELYQKMNALQSDLSTANEACIKDVEDKKAQMVQEQARIDAVNKEYSKKGDEVLNRYTDAIVEDIRSRVAEKLNIPVYGGSTYMEWFRLYGVKELELPNILVTAKPTFTMQRRTYSVIDQNGNEITRPCVKDKLPLEYQFVVGILAKTEDETNVLKKALVDVYSDAIQLDILVPELNAETIQLKMQYDSAKPIALQTLNDGLFGNIYKALLCFSNSSTAYFVKEYSKEELKDNQRLQLRLVQQALYMLDCSESLKYSAIHKLDTDYKALITKKSSIFGFLRNENYKKLKMQFDTGAAIDKELFNSVLKDITAYFPSLYDRMLAGWTYEQLKEYMQGYVHYFEERHKTLCSILGIPTTFLGLSYPTPRSRDSLRACIELMELPHYSLNQALVDFRNYEAERQAQQDAEDEARREARRESGGSSILGGVLKTAAGVAIGNSVSNKLSTKSNKQSSSKASYSSKAYYDCKTGCKFKYYEHGMARCRISNEWSNRPAPEKCGYGSRYK